MAAQLTQRPFTLFNTTARTASPSSPAPAPFKGDVPSASKRRLINIQAGLAELMLLNRLRARTRRDRGGDTLERAAQIIEVTSRHWFAEPVNLMQAEPDALDESAMEPRARAQELPELPQH